MQDAKLFYHLETWELSPDNPSVTAYLSLVTTLQEHNAKVAHTIASRGGDKGTEVRNIVIIRD
jgi:hypothetical protein